MTRKNLKFVNDNNPTEQWQLVGRLDEEFEGDEFEGDSDKLPGFVVACQGQLAWVNSDGVGLNHSSYNHPVVRLRDFHVPKGR